LAETAHPGSAITNSDHSSEQKEQQHLPPYLQSPQIGSCQELIAFVYHLVKGKNNELASIYTESKTELTLMGVRAGMRVADFSSVQPYLSVTKQKAGNWIPHTQGHG
jgi:hypothetical protein